MSVAIMILHYNSFEKTKVCVESCLKQDYTEYQIFVVDNYSTDDSLSKLKNEYDGMVSFVENSVNYGFAKGNNKAISFARDLGFDYTLCLNNDIQLIGSDFLSRLMEVFSKVKNVALVAPLIYNITQNGLELNPNDSFYLKLLRFLKVLPANKMLDSHLVEISEAQGSVLLLNNAIFMSVGGFPEHYFMYNEESFLAKKILWDNKKIVWFKSEDIYALHSHDKTGHIDSWRLKLMGRNRALEYYENRSRAYISWSIAYYASLLVARIKKMDSAFFEGVKKGKELAKSKCSYEEILENAKKIRCGGE